MVAFIHPLKWFLSRALALLYGIVLTSKVCLPHFDWSVCKDPLDSQIHVPRESVQEVICALFQVFTGEFANSG